MLVCQSTGKDGCFYSGVLVASVYVHLGIFYIHKDHPNRVDKAEDYEEQYPHFSRVF